MAAMHDELTSRPHDGIGRLVAGGAVSVAEKLTLRSVAAVLAADDIGAVLVHSDAGIRGIVSERDVARALAVVVDPDAFWSVDVMSEPLLTADRDATIISVAVRMVADNVRHIVVTDGDDVIGVVSARDVFRVLAVDALESAEA